MRITSLRSLVIASTLITAIGCGTSDGSTFTAPTQSSAPTEPAENDVGASSSGDMRFGDDVAGNIELDPKNAIVVIDSATTPATPGSLTYRVTSNGADVANAKLELSDPTLGTFSGNTFTSGVTLPAGKMGVSTTVKASAKNGTGQTRLTIVKLRKSGNQRDFFFVVPYMQDPSPKSDVLAFGTAIKQVDVAFSMDTTGSMAGSILNLKNALSGTLLSDLQAAIPDVGLAIVDQKDYPIPTYGMPADWPVKVRQKITTVLGDAQAAVAEYSADGGYDSPEAQIPAMQHILTGEALMWGSTGISAVTPSPGHFGAVDFRPGSVPVVVNITDTTWHDTNMVPYSFPTPTMASLKTAFTANSAFFVDITSGPEDQANDLSDATSSHVPPSAFGGACGAGQCCTGVDGAARPPTGPDGSCRLNFLHWQGNGVSTGVVKAIQAIALGAAYDVKAVPTNDPSNPNGVDATKLIRALRAMDEGNPTEGCPAGPAKDTDGDGIKDTFISVTVGTKVCFEVIPAMNQIVPPTDQPQFFNAFVDVIGVQGNVQLDKRNVLFLVPPKDVGVTN